MSGVNRVNSNNQYNKGKVSFCVLGYKHVDFLEDCIRSIWNIEYDNIEIVAIDDGSDDGSVELLNKLKSQSECDFTVIAQKNSGIIGYNFNRALEKATGEYVSFISLDDIYDSEEMSVVINKIVNEPKAAFIACTKIQGVTSDGKNKIDIEPVKVDEYDNPSISDILEMEYNNFWAFYLQGCVIRREIVNQVNGFDEDLIGDDIILRTKIFKYLKNNSDYTFLLHRKSVVLYRRHDNNVSNNGARQMQIVSEYLDRYWSDRDSPELFFSWYYGVMTHENFLKLKVMNKKMESEYYKIMENFDFVSRMFFRLYRDFMNTLDSEKFRALNILYKDCKYKNMRMRILHMMFNFPFGITLLKLNKKLKNK